MSADEQSLNPSTASAAAAEQLYDELMARAWALDAAISDRCDEVIGDEMRHRLARRAVEIAKALPADPAAHALLERLLWPASTPPQATDPWWLTPLGLLTRAQHHAA